MHTRNLFIVRHFTCPDLVVGYKSGRPLCKTKKLINGNSSQRQLACAFWPGGKILHMFTMQSISRGVKVLEHDSENVQDDSMNVPCPTRRREAETVRIFDGRIPSAARGAVSGLLVSRISRGSDFAGSRGVECSIRLVDYPNRDHGAEPNSGPLRESSNHTRFRSYARHCTDYLNLTGSGRDMSAARCDHYSLQYALLINDLDGEADVEPSAAGSTSSSESRLYHHAGGCKIWEGII